MTAFYASGYNVPFAASFHPMLAQWPSGPWSQVLAEEVSFTELTELDDAALIEDPWVNQYAV